MSFNLDMTCWFCVLVALFCGLCCHANEDIQNCNSKNCKLPDCLCPSMANPLGFKSEETPQIVLFGFNNAVSQDNFDIYTKELFTPDVKNPNGCPVTATFYISHKWTDYKLAKKLFKLGHEIATQSTSHRLPRDWWANATLTDWAREMDGHRRFFAKKAGIPRDQIRGLRAPYLQLGGDVQFTMMKNRGFHFDSSFLTGPLEEGQVNHLPFWPFSLDFPPNSTLCDIRPCPKKSYPGLWEIPLNRWIGLDGKGCPIVDSCGKPKTENEALGLLRSNFLRHYLHNRAPFSINLHSKWLENSRNMAAMKTFLNQMVLLGDVWIVKASQAIEWLQQPRKSPELREFKEWKQECGLIKAEKPSVKKSRPATARSDQPVTTRPGRPATKVVRESSIEKSTIVKSNRNKTETPKIRSKQSHNSSSAAPYFSVKFEAIVMLFAGLIVGYL